MDSSQGIASRHGRPWFDRRHSADSLVAPHPADAMAHPCHPDRSPAFAKFYRHRPHRSSVKTNRDLRVLLLQVYLVCPALLSLLVLAILLPMRGGEGQSAVASVSNLIGIGFLVSVLLGIGAAFVGFVILAFQATVEGTAMRFFA